MKELANQAVHGTLSVDDMQGVMFGVWVARKGWLTKGDVLNCLDAEAFLAKKPARR